MKRKLLYVTTVLLFSVGFINAQTTVWNFSDNTVSVNGSVTIASPAFPAAGVLTSASGSTAGTSPNTIKVGGLNLYGNTSVNSSAFAAISDNSQTFSDGFVGANRASTGGSSAAAANTFLPTVRYFSFNASGPCTVKAWIKHTTGIPSNGSAPTTRTLYVSNGTALYGSGSVTNDVTANLSNVVTVNITNSGLVYIYGDSSFAVYKIEVSGATLSTNNFQTDSKVTIFGADGKINVANVNAATKVSAYSVTGALVKSTQTSEDVSLSVNNGVYIVKAESAEGIKTAKVLVN
ncbi:T9SS type A sorting domain-containing protein [Flavobacterium hibisci]|uniref:T9SS type A sorting domain-containing protein n=1 Tax=Flavobacterium hibisci TaxID=1914462 RepID=UPI001CBF8594|nr:T9SS type A sorting domain-containing protein [Flavobacterium hibisci]MBZ4041821.1 T9SS type A sorting domain-containing protein [Flavobacterium hibisci]